MFYYPPTQKRTILHKISPTRLEVLHHTGPFSERPTKRSCVQMSVKIDMGAVKNTVPATQYYSNAILTKSRWNNSRAKGMTV